MLILRLKSFYPPLENSTTRIAIMEGNRKHNKKGHIIQCLSIKKWLQEILDDFLLQSLTCHNVCSKKKGYQAQQSITTALGNLFSEQTLFTVLYNCKMFCQSTLRKSTLTHILSKRNLLCAQGKMGRNVQLNSPKEIRLYDTYKTNYTEHYLIKTTIFFLILAFPILYILGQILSTFGH